MLLIVGRVGRAHGLRGEVLVQLRTDDPDTRFALGATLATQPPERGPLTVATARRHSGRYVVGFAGVTDRSGAEALRGTDLVVDSADLSPPEDPDEFHDAELLGLAVETPAGARVGELADVVHGPGADLLVIRMDDREVLVPFIREMVPTVDVAGGRVVIDPPEGLLEL
ncbi:MAG: ribosome maturation factor RimM [Pseudonocardiales bacterium]|nr:MAG: ribosome maturation factor RimM [Pseudonocardiales bacterium]